MQNNMKNNMQNNDKYDKYGDLNHRYAEKNVYPKTDEYDTESYGEEPDLRVDSYMTDHDCLDMVDVCSSMDCTGMIASGPVDEEELMDYQEMYKFGRLDIDDSI